MSPEITIARGSFAALQLGSAAKDVMAGFPTGRIEVTQGTARRYIWFQNGRVRSITSKVESERLGSWLTTRGLVNRKVLRDILINKPRTERLGNVMVERGLIDKPRVHEELEALAMTVAGRMALLDGEYEAVSDQRLPSDALFLDALPLPLFLLAARRVPDTGNFEVATGSGRRWSAAVLAGPAGSGTELLPMEQFVLVQLGEPRTLEELQALAPEKGHDIARALACLAAGGLVAFTELAIKSIVVEQAPARVPPVPAPPPPRPAPAGPSPQAGPTAVPPAPPSEPVVTPPPLEWQLVPADPTPSLEWQVVPSPAAEIPVLVQLPVYDEPAPPMPEAPAVPPPASPRRGRRMSTLFPAANPELRAVLAEVASIPSGGRPAGAAASSGANEPVLETTTAAVIKERARALASSGNDPHEACRLLQQAVELEPDADSLVLLAELEAGDPSRRQVTLDHLKQAVGLDPRHTGAWLALANYWNARGEPTKQRRCLEKILVYEPGNEAAKKAIAVISNG